MQLYPLEVQRLHRTTANSICIELERPASLREQFRFVPGQFVTLKLNIDGKELQRSYSISSSPDQFGSLQLTVKEVPGGEASRWLCRKLRTGARLQVSSPMGGFTPPPSRATSRHYYLFAAGSGISPLLSVIRTVLQREPGSRLFLLYGSRDQRQIIQLDQLTELEQRYGSRLVISHSLSQPISNPLSRVLKRCRRWQGLRGRIDMQAVMNFMRRNSPGGVESCYMICGPDEMMNNCRRALLSLGAEPAEILSEHFIPGMGNGNDSGQAANLALKLDGRQLRLEVKPNESLLDAALRDQVDVPYSCQSGACGCCRARLLNGEVERGDLSALQQEQISRGEILLCQCWAASPQLSIEVESEPG
ncbi:ferredoxin--NADP reductase [Marinobacterium jannaschii]|uniref:ferredoxin--NADP reductase n=1 Tax=Marinobacterium jannaschii TaxID=64970 RepID=UPI000481ABD1|nr:ferredoxin--NADP reductase [Marinobacterium jannaschii]